MYFIAFLSNLLQRHELRYQSESEAMSHSREGTVLMNFQQLMGRIPIPRRIDSCAALQTLNLHTDTRTSTR